MRALPRAEGFFAYRSHSDVASIFWRFRTARRWRKAWARTALTTARRINRHGRPEGINEDADAAKAGVADMQQERHAMAPITKERDEKRVFNVVDNCCFELLGVWKSGDWLRNNGESNATADEVV